LPRSDVPIRGCVGEPLSFQVTVHVEAPLTWVSDAVLSARRTELLDGAEELLRFGWAGVGQRCSERSMPAVRSGAALGRGVREAR
jgi:hypothetical protein